MSSFLHEGLVALLREHPPLVLDLLRSSQGIEVEGAASVQTDAAALTAPGPAERRADLVLLCRRGGDEPSYGLVVEVQLAADPDKLFRWPAYAAQLRARRRCPVDVLVVCVDAALARALAAPIALGRGGSVFRPLVLGPEAVPPVTTVERARHEPELAVLAALAHRDGEAGLEAAHAAAVAAAGLDGRRRGFYLDLVLGALSEAARTAVEARMAQGGYQYQTELARTYFAQGEQKGRAEGEAIGKARALLAVLEARGLEVSEEQRGHILGCNDAGQLERWVRRAVTIKSTALLLAAKGRRPKAGALHRRPLRLARSTGGPAAVRESAPAPSARSSSPSRCASRATPAARTAGGAR